MFFVFGVPRRGLRSSAYSFSSDSRYIDVLYYIFIYIYIDKWEAKELPRVSQLHDRESYSSEGAESSNPHPC